MAAPPLTHPRAHPNPMLPGPRPAVILPPSYPPAPRRWSAQLPVVPSRGGYISPDPSPTEQEFACPPPQPPQPPQRSFSYPQAEYYHFRDTPHYPSHPLERRASDVAMHQGERDAQRQRQPQEVDPFFYPLIPKTTGPAQVKKNKAPRKTDGKQPTFLTKLYQILEQPEYAHIIRWDEAGEIIIIEKPDELADKILPLVYRQSRFASFSRQLNIYGFMRKVSLRHVDRGIIDPDASTWSHPFLRRSSTASEIQGFKRRVPPRPSQGTKRRSLVSTTLHDDPTFGLALSPTSSDGSYQSPPDAYHHHLLQDLQEEKPSVFGTNPINIVGYKEPGSSPESPGGYFSNRRPMYPQAIAMPAPPTMMTSGPPSLFSNRDALGGGIPASAPAHISNFSGLNLRVSQDHIRTRSVQDEPPSATLFSPTSPFTSARVPEQPSGAAELSGEGNLPQNSPPNPEVVAGPALREDRDVPPTYDLNDPSTWLRRSYTDINAGAPMPPPSLSLPRPDLTPASLPRDFAPAYISPPLPATEAVNIPATATVSPGIYQSGFSVPSLSYRSTVTPSTPRPTPSRTDRRASFGASPYSPRSRGGPALSASLGAIRGLGRDEGSSRGTSGAGGDPKNGMDGQKVNGEFDDGLPSAGLRLHRGPFEGIIPDDDSLMQE